MKYEKGTFIVVPNALALAQLPAGAQALFMWLCYYADSEGKCFPSRIKLSGHLQVSERTIDSYIKVLEESQIITKTTRVSGNEKQTNLYHIMLVGGGANISPPGANFAGGGGAKSAHRTKSNNNSIYLTKPPIVPQQGDREKEFELFWKLYPRKIGKGAAWMKWLKLKPSCELVEKIYSAVEKQKNTDQWKRDAGQFIPHPATWLHQRRWEDEIETPAPSAGVWNLNTNTFH